VAVSVATGAGVAVSVATGSGVAVSVATGSGVVVSVAPGSGVAVSVATGSGVDVSVASGAGVDVSVGTGVAVVVAVGTGALQLAQHEATTVPPRLVHADSDESGRQRLVTAESGSWQATLPSGLPQIERMAQLLILVRHFLGTKPSRTRRLTTRLTHAV
jgi:hypothetical protein